MSPPRRRWNVEYANATRDLTIAREKYEQLLNRQMDAEVSEAAIVGGRADEFRLVQAPMLPGPPPNPIVLRSC